MRSLPMHCVRYTQGDSKFGSRACAKAHAIELSKRRGVLPRYYPPLRQSQSRGFGAAREPNFESSWVYLFFLLFVSFAIGAESFDYDVHLTCLEGKEPRTMICFHGYGANYKIAHFLKDQKFLSATLVSFNFPDHDLQDREYDPMKATFGTIDELLPALYVMKKTVLEQALKSVDLYGFSAGGAAVINVISVLNSSKYDARLQEIGIGALEKKKLLNAIQKGVVILDTPLKSVEEIIELRGSTEEFEILAKNYRENGFRPMDSLEGLKGLALDIFLHFQKEDEILSNRDDAEFIDRLSKINKKGRLTVIVEDDGGHLAPHHSLWKVFAEKKHRSLAVLREGTKIFNELVGKAAPIDFEDRTVLVRDHSPLSIRIFNPSMKGPVLIFYPGCGFVFDLFEVNSVICSRIAEASGIKVILVPFRLAPEHPLLTCLQDCYDAAAEIALHPKDFEIDPEKIFLGGWCSGAHCATVVSNLARKEKKFTLHHQILLGGYFDLKQSCHDFDAYECQDKTLNRQLLSHLANQYYEVDDLENPLFSPYYENDFKGFPSTTILCGEFDALRNDSESYFQKLSSGHVAVEKTVLKGQTHNSIAIRGSSAETPDPAMIIAEIIKSKL